MDDTEQQPEKPPWEAVYPDERKILPPRKPRPTPQCATCARCGHPILSAIPTYSVGMGLAYRPIADDVRCHRCGHIGPATIAGIPPD